MAKKLGQTKKRQYTRREGSKPPGRPKKEQRELVKVRFTLSVPTALANKIEVLAGQNGFDNRSVFGVYLLEQGLKRFEYNQKRKAAK